MARRRTIADDESDEGNMDRSMDWISDKTDGEELHGASKRGHRRQRPMSRVQEFALLAIAFAIGAGLQVAYLFNGTPMLP
jgi:hypothetical protein